VAELRAARADGERVVLEGFHPLKHALRFGAVVERVVTYDLRALLTLADQHAPEVRESLAAEAVEIPRKEFRRLGPYEPHTGVVSIARRVQHEARAVLERAGPDPVVLLEEPRHRGNLGAVVRVAAAAQAAGVVAVGGEDPWHPVTVRGSAGLHFATPVAWLERWPEEGLPGGRALVAFDPAGAAFDPRALAARPVLAFGSERRGLSAQLRERADVVLALPMRAGVSSLNLATTVSAVIYSVRLARPA
jgi:TrmH family RNA methyltransferase